MFQYIANGGAIAAGRRAPEELAVRALDDFSLSFQLESTIPFLRQLVATRFFFAVPRQAIEAARRRGAESSWTQPESIVTSGAFTLRERHPYEKILLVRSPTYYEAHTVSLDEILFLPVVDGSTSANLYRDGEAAFTMPMSPEVLAGVHRKKDVHTYRNFGANFPVMNTKPSLNDVCVRYAFNMATDKRAIASFLGDGRTPLAGVVPPLKGHEPPTGLPVVIDGAAFDVLSYNPEAARALLAKAGGPTGVSVEYLFPTLPEFKPVAEILQQQWRRNLGIELHLVCQEVQTWSQTVLNVAYNGVAAWGEIGGLKDPTWFLGMFKAQSGASGTGWHDPHYDDLLTAAKTTIAPAARMRKLAACEPCLLQAMPCLPLYSDAWVYLCKPFVNGLAGDPFHGRMFNDVRIGPTWRSR